MLSHPVRKTSMEPGTSSLSETPQLDADYYYDCVSINACVTIIRAANYPRLPIRHVQ